MCNVSLSLPFSVCFPLFYRVMSKRMSHVSIRFSSYIVWAKCAHTFGGYGHCYLFTLILWNCNVWSFNHSANHAQCSGTQRAKRHTRATNEKKTHLTQYNWIQATVSQQKDERKRHSRGKKTFEERKRKREREKKLHRTIKVDGIVNSIVMVC